MKTVPGLTEVRPPSDLPVPSLLIWPIIAGSGAATVVSYAIVAEYFPTEISGQANSALNTLHISGAFVIQTAIGLVVGFRHLLPKNAQDRRRRDQHHGGKLGPDRIVGLLHRATVFLEQPSIGEIVPESHDGVEHQRSTKLRILGASVRIVLAGHNDASVRKL